MKTSINEELGTMEERFQKEFENARDYNLHWNEIEDVVKDFISGEISQAITVEREKPMGVSQWKEHGIKNGYWDYFEKEVINAERKDLREMVEKIESHVQSRFGLGHPSNDKVDNLISREQVLSLLEEK